MDEWIDGWMERKAGFTKLMGECKNVSERIDRWVDGWMDVKAGLRIAYSNQKLNVAVWFIFILSWSLPLFQGGSCDQPSALLREQAPCVRTTIVVPLVPITRHDALLAL